MNIPEVLRKAATAIESASGELLTNTSLRQVETGRWRTLTIGFLVRDEDELFIDYLTDVLANMGEPVVGSEGQEARQETT